MKQFDIYEKCENFAVHTITFLEKIPYRRSIGIISDQVMRSSASVGANLNEADNARSRKEFCSCIGISLKEIKETIFWLNILMRTNQQYSKIINELKDEAIIIKKILGKIYNNTKMTI